MLLFMYSLYPSLRPSLPWHTAISHVDRTLPQSYVWFFLFFQLCTVSIRVARIYDVLFHMYVSMCTSIHPFSHSSILLHVSAATGLSGPRPLVVQSGAHCVRFTSTTTIVSYYVVL